MANKFYLTTAIAYTSSKPHIGNVYEAILADAIVRYKKKMGFETYFQTGTDEHGQKIQTKAESEGISPQEHVDRISSGIQNIYRMMNVRYDRFIRTTDESHVREVAKVFEKLYQKKDIYKGTYEGNYCVSCESFFTSKDLVDGKCPDCGSAVQVMKEEAYFLKLSTYQDRLIEHIKTHPDFIQPESRKNEMLNNFLSKPLPDLCVSRTSYTWGIPVTFEPNHVIYVWMDALLNYITGLGYHTDRKSDPLFRKFWPADVHLIGKDILRFHTIYWPIMLMALDLPLPKQVFGHPWILMNHNKMSKSKGNVIYAEDLVEIFGVDPVRYYVLHEIPFASDGNITYELVCERTNADLANTLGNLLHRTMGMAERYFHKEVVQTKSFAQDMELEQAVIQTVNQYRTNMDAFKVADAMEEVIKLLRMSNRYIDMTAPWVLYKDETKREELMSVLYHLLETIRISAILLEPMIPGTSEKIYRQIHTQKTSFEDLSYGSQKEYRLQTSEVLFQRLDVEKDVLSVVLKKEAAQEASIKPAEAPITIEDFNRVQLVVGQITEAKKHPSADKLLIFQVSLKTEVRQIVSKIADFYRPEELVGRKVVVVKNLKPITLRNESSQGMLLCASDEKDSNVHLVFMDDAEVGDLVK